MKQSMLLFTLFYIILATQYFTNASASFHKVKRNIQKNQKSLTYGVSTCCLAFLCKTYFWITKKEYKAPFFHKSKTATKQKQQLQLSFCFINPETEIFQQIKNEMFDCYRAEQDSNINRINLIYTKELCDRIRIILDQVDQNTYKQYSITTYQFHVPEEDFCFIDADFILSSTIFNLVPKGTTQKKK